MMRKSKKKVEWKETNNFIFTPKYEYSLPVRNRFVFFWCTGNRYKKMLNYAENFVSPCSICVVYIFGDFGKRETFEAFLKQKKGNILALHLPNIQQEIDTVERFSEWLEALKARGQLKVIDEGAKKSQYSKVTVGRKYADEPSDLWIREYENTKKAVADGYSDYKNWLDCLQSKYELWTMEYPAAVAKIRTELESGYEAYGIASGLVVGSEADHNNALMKIARSIYPCGIEADTEKDFCYKMAAVKRMAQGAINNEGADSLGIKLSERIGYQFNLFEAVTTGATEAISILTEWCKRQIKTNGCFNAGEAWLIYARPPFGAYQCNWYTWIFAYALREYANEKYLFCPGTSKGGTVLASQRMRPDGFHYSALFGGIVFVQNEAQNEFMRLLMKMFDIEKPWEETTHSVLSQSRAWITDNIHYVPLAALDPKWGEILQYREDSYWFTFGYEKEYLPWLRDNFDYFYTAIRQLDAKLHERLINEYGQVRADLYSKYAYVKGGAIGWLWDAEYMEGMIKKYMSYKNVCRECGNTLVPEGLKIREYEAHVKIEEGKYETLVFNEKDIIGLNKKLLGRYQNEYFCIPCLCEVLDTDVARLHEMLEEFRESGCQLFA